MNDERLAADDELLFGFTTREWVAGGVLSAASVAFIRDAIASGAALGPEEISREGWLDMARLSSAHARRVESTVAALWTGWAVARRDIIPELTEENLRHDFLGWAREIEDDLRELHRLAGRPENRTLRPCCLTRRCS